MKLQGQSHEFVPGALDRTKCNICKYSFIQHTRAAHCEACDAMCELELFGPLGNPKSMLLCPSCIAKELSTATTEGKEREKLWEKAAEQDKQIVYNGDFFNAATIPTVDVRTSIFESGMTEQQQKEVFSKFLGDRIQHLKETVFLTLHEVSKTDQFTKRAIHENLREFASGLHREITERIKKEDPTYTSPVVKKVSPSIKKVTKSPMDKLIEALALAKGCSKEQAMEMIQKGKM